jgi:hypothetical protein
MTNEDDRADFTGIRHQRRADRYRFEACRRFERHALLVTR